MGHHHDPRQPPTLDPEAETPPAQPRARNVVRDGHHAAPSTGSTRRWQPADQLAFAALAVAVLGPLIALSFHAYGLARDVEQMKAEATDHAKEVSARRVINEARFQSIESRMSAAENTAASDRRYIELEFSGITKSLDALKTDIADIKRQTK